jgi:hypothetical protein
MLTFRGTGWLCEDTLACGAPRSAAPSLRTAYGVAHGQILLRLQVRRVAGVSWEWMDRAAEFGRGGRGHSNVMPVWTAHWFSCPLETQVPYGYAIALMIAKHTQACLQLAFRCGSSHDEHERCAGRSNCQSSLERFERAWRLLACNRSKSCLPDGHLRARPSAQPQRFGPAICAGAVSGQGLSERAPGL